MKQGKNNCMFGERLRIAREAMNLSQAQLGTMIGIGPGSISQWERGSSLPRADHLANLCEKLGVSADFLLSLNQSQEQIEESATGLQWRTYVPSKEDSNYNTLALGITLFEQIVRHSQSIKSLITTAPFSSYSVIELRRALRAVLLNRNIEIRHVPRDLKREKRLRDHYKDSLRSIFVADLLLNSKWPIESALRSEIVGWLAAKHVIATLPPAGTVGLSGGNMMSRFVSLIPHSLRSLAGMKWISLVATSPEYGFAPTGSDALVAHIAQTQPHTTSFQLPYLFPNLRKIERLESISQSEETYLSYSERLYVMARQVDCVITSVGGPTFNPNHLDVDLGLGLMKLSDLLRRTAPEMRVTCAGVLNLYMIDDHGNRWGTPELQAINESTFSSIELEDLSAMVELGKNVWLLVDRDEKARATHAAIISGRGNCLIADAQAADRLLERSVP